MPSGRHVEENCSAAMLTTKETTGLAPDVNLGEPLTRTPLPSTNKRLFTRNEIQPYFFIFDICPIFSLTLFQWISGRMGCEPILTDIQPVTIDTMLNWISGRYQKWKNQAEFRNVWTLLKAAHSRFEPKRRRHEKSKIGVSVAPQKVLCPPNFFF